MAEDGRRQRVHYYLWYVVLTLLKDLPQFEQSNIQMYNRKWGCQGGIFQQNRCFLTFFRQNRHILSIFRRSVNFRQTLAPVLQKYVHYHLQKSSIIFSKLKMRFTILLKQKQILLRKIKFFIEDLLYILCQKNTLITITTSIPLNKPVMHV